VGNGTDTDWAPKENRACSSDCAAEEPIRRRARTAGELDPESPGIMRVAQIDHLLSQHYAFAPTRSERCAATPAADHRVSRTAARRP